jgi:hypothetical protein
MPSSLSPERRRLAQRRGGVSAPKLTGRTATTLMPLVEEIRAYVFAAERIHSL